ncbi:hypothetical protein NBT05_17890 [Aquimarina sp. ERC-38]|uniref:DUF6702 family protein n=1 Tax=Aquimarina sp. ERC-38 TaxID=2949996 RepID=UPI0022484E46|nr:DUF6702 family protein [Aquimarina sp. ERC-38]UZO80797.1 hypothetical protein NBT05_17890 [Aquimarina sp. ERC-38]
MGSFYFRFFKYVSFLLLISILVSFINLHKFYVSVTQIEFVKEKKALQIISRVFVDDIEKVLNERFGTNFRLDPEKEQPEIQKYVNNYFHKKFNLEVNDQKVETVFIGMEYENDLLLCYLEVNNVKELAQITVENSLLLDLFSEQQNIIHVITEKERKSIILQDEEIKGMLKFGE